MAPHQEVLSQSQEEDTTSLGCTEMVATKIPAVHASTAATTDDTTEKVDVRKEITEAIATAVEDDGKYKEFVDFVGFLDFLQDDSPTAATTTPTQQSEDGTHENKDSDSISWSDIVDGKSKEATDGQDSDDEFATFLDCLNKETKTDTNSNTKEEEFAAFLSSSTTTCIPAKKSVEEEDIWSQIVKGMSDTQKMEMMQKKSEGGEEASWFSWKSLFGAAPVKPEERAEPESVV